MTQIVFFDKRWLLIIISSLAIILILFFFAFCIRSFIFRLLYEPEITKKCIKIMQNTKRVDSYFGGITDIKPKLKMGFYLRTKGETKTGAFNFLVLGRNKKRNVMVEWDQEPSAFKIKSIKVREGLWYSCVIWQDGKAETNITSPTIPYYIWDSLIMFIFGIALIFCGLGLRRNLETFLRLFPFSDKYFCKNVYELLCYQGAIINFVWGTLCFFNRWPLL